MSRLPIIGVSASRGVNDPEPLAAIGERRPGWLTDRQGRGLRYLRLSVTDRCDLRCKYCMPEAGVPASPRDELLQFEEIARVARIFRLLGVRTVRLTGGEPLIRKKLPQLIRMLRDEAGVEDIALTTNATALKPVARDLVAAGLQRINISIDALEPERFARLTRGGDLSRVIAGVDAIQSAGIAETKTNSVVIRGENDGPHLAEIVEWGWARNITPRFIELMPIGEGARLGSDAIVPVREMQASLRRDLALEETASGDDGRGPAQYLHSSDRSNRVGFIGAVTENFCDRCNRVRVTSRGEIRACLASPDGLDLRALIRTHPDDAPIIDAIQQTLFGKGDGHEFQVTGADAHTLVDMSRIGG